MWLGLVLILAVALALIGGVVVGGVFAFILVPIAAIIVVTALVMSMWARANRPREGAQRPGSPDNSLPHGAHSNAASTPATPDQLVDARQQAQ
jgi:hypothetical protein